MDVGDDLDDLIDGLTERVFSGDTSPDAGFMPGRGCLRARSELSLRSAALALAAVAPLARWLPRTPLLPHTAEPGASILAPALLEALGLLALRSPLARARTSELLLRLRR